MNFDVVDAMLSVTDKQCFDMCLRMSREEGLLTGGSSGLNMHAAVELSGRCAPGAVIVVVLPDSGIKYLSKIYSPEWRRSKGFEATPDDSKEPSEHGGDAAEDPGDVPDPQVEINVERVAEAMGAARVATALGVSERSASAKALVETVVESNASLDRLDKLVDAQVEEEWRRWSDGGRDPRGPTGWERGRVKFFSQIPRQIAWHGGAHFRDTSCGTVCVSSSAHFL